MSTENKNDMSLKDRLDELIKIKMSGNYSTLARMAGIHPTTLQSIKNGTEPKVYTIMKIAKALGVTTDYLIEGIGQVNESKPINKRAEKIAEMLEGLDEAEQRKILSYIKEKKQLKELRTIIKEMQKKRA